MIAAGKLTDWWLYLLAPLLGGVAATTVCDRLLRAGSAPQALRRSSDLLSVVDQG
jgi:hypothetical protein